MKNYSYKSIALHLIFLASLVGSSAFAGGDEDYYNVEKSYGNPHFNSEVFKLSGEKFVKLISNVAGKFQKKALFVEVPDSLYSASISNLKTAGFFQYYSYPERDATVWCKTNASGVPLATTHTYGAKAVV